ASLAAKASPQIVAGFYDMTGAQLRVIEGLREAGKLEAIYVPADDSPKYAFATPFVQRYSSLITQHSALIHIKAPASRVAQYDNRIEEIRGVCDEVAALLTDGAAPAGIGVVARTLDPYDIHLLNRFAAERGFGTS